MCNHLHVVSPGNFAIAKAKCCTNLFVVHYVRDTFVVSTIVVYYNRLSFVLSVMHMHNRRDNRHENNTKPIYTVRWVGVGGDGPGRDGTLSFYYSAVGFFTLYYFVVGT